MIDILTLPQNIHYEYSEYCLKVLNNSKTYITNNGVERVDRIYINDETWPGLNEQFILNHNLKQLNWNNYNLKKGLIFNIDNISYPPFSLTIKLIEYLEQTIQKKFIMPRGNFLYNPNGGMGWHTNSDVPGTRVYVSFTQYENNSFFRYLENNEVITSWDKKGLNVRVFNVKSEPQDWLWHCVGTLKYPRLSFGYLFK